MPGTERSLADRVTVVVRTAGERTVAACVALAEQQAPGTEVVPIEEVPFSRAVEVAFELGVDRGRDWTLCLDADVVLRTGALAALVAAADAADPDAACVEGLVCDLLLARRRPAGCHLYRTSVLSRALATCRFDPGAIRPERHVKEQLAALGHPLVWSDVVVGLHDAEQWYADVFRTAHVVAHKFADEVEHWAGAWWRERGAAGDPDLLVAALAASVAGSSGDVPVIDRRTYPDDIDQLLALVGLEERPPLGAADLSQQEVDARVASFTQHPDALAWDRFQQTWGAGRLGPLRAMLDRHGVVGLAGEALRRAGDALDPDARRPG